ncbi:MAG: hypothetical protein ACRD8U_15900 [Pyrinomonadaceae bacterium]
MERRVVRSRSHVYTCGRPVSLRSHLRAKQEIGDCIPIAGTAVELMFKPAN